jgi:hypothetical protein
MAPPKSLGDQVRDLDMKEDEMEKPEHVVGGVGGRAGGSAKVTWRGRP